MGLPMIEIQEALKHAHPNMTQYYASLTAEQVAKRTQEDLARRRAYLARREMQKGKMTNGNGAASDREAA